MLEIKNFTKKYKNRVACDNLSFKLEGGSITVLLGPNGAGKSTLIKSVAGLLRYTGQILIDGKEASLAESRRKIGYVSEIPSFYPNLTIIEHLEFIARAYRLKNYRERCIKLLQLFELYEFRYRFGDELSKGMQQKLNLCMGLLIEPTIILLDEPFIGLDPHSIKALKEKLLELKKQGCTILISTHIIDSVEDIWDRTLIMKKGKIEADLNRNDIDEGSLELKFFTVTED